MLGFLPNVRHGRYTIIRKIAEGGMAEIFLAKQSGSEGFEKLVILKRILTAFYADDQFRNMLIDEAHISMGLSHNNIVHILDVGKAGGRFFLVLELVDGWDLGRILHRVEAAKIPLPPGLALYILTEVCRALSYAHAKTDPRGRPLGIVHRDVSPQNVLVSAQGEVKITDFGVAKAMTKRDRTGAGIVKGKLAFMSPEQALGQEIDARADLYAIGILLYLLTTGRRPFDGPTDMEVLVRVQSGQFPPPEQANPALSPSLRHVIRKAMSFDRAQRYQSADELLIDLEGIMRSEFGSSGQTALKLWLAALSRRDGEMPISHAQAMRFSKPGSESVEGKSVELGDEDSDDEEDVAADLGRLEASVGRVSEPTVRAVPQRRAMTPRITGSEATSLSDLAVALSDDGPRAGSVSAVHGGRQTRHHATSDMGLPVADDEPPVRMGRRSGGFGFFKGLIAVGVLGGAAAGIWHMLQGKNEDPSAAASPPAEAAPASAAAAPTPAPAVAVPAAPTPAVAPAAPAPRANPPAAEDKRTAHERTHAPAPDPYARARSWQKPEEPISPGLTPTPAEHTEPKPAEEKPAAEGTGTTP